MIDTDMTVCCLQEALQRVSNATAHYSSTRTLNQTEQPLLQAAARSLVNVVCPYTAACFQRVYPESGVQVDAQAGSKGLRDNIHNWEEEERQQKGTV